MKLHSKVRSAQTLVLDGYNVIHAIPSLEKTLTVSLQKAREELVRYCHSYQCTRGDIRRIVIVFDGQSRYADSGYSGFHTGASVEVVFSDEEQKADDKIIELIHHAHPQGWLVVSNDNYVINNTRAFGVSSVSVGQFQTAVEKRRFQKNSPKTQTASILTVREADAITQAYKQHLGIQ